MKKHFSIFVLLLVVVVGSVFLLTSCGGNSTSKPKAGEANVVQTNDQSYSVKYYTDGGYIKLSGKDASRMNIVGYQGEVKEINLAKIEDKIKVDGKKINVYQVGGFNGCTTLENVDLSKKNPTDEFLIMDKAFRNCDNLKTVTLPNNLFANNGYSIGKFAFANCKALTKVNNLDKFSNLKEGVFSNSKLLDNVVLSKDIINIPDNLFFGCNGLKTVTLGNNIENFGNGSFAYTNVSGIKFNDMKNLEIVGDGAFFNARLTDVTLPDSFEYLGIGAFINNPLTNVNIPYISSYDHGFYAYNNYFGIDYDTYFANDTTFADLDATAKYNKMPSVNVVIRSIGNKGNEDSMFRNNFSSRIEFRSTDSEIFGDKFINKADYVKQVALNTNSNIKTIKADFVKNGLYDWDKDGIMDRVELTPEYCAISDASYFTQFNLTSCIVNGVETFVPVA